MLILKTSLKEQPALKGTLDSSLDLLAYLTCYYDKKKCSYCKAVNKICD